MADYYYSREGKVKGPLPLTEIVQYVKKRKLPPDLKVCLVGKKEWKSLRLVAPEAANIASPGKVIGWSIGGAVGGVLLLMGALWIFSSSGTEDPEGDGNKDNKPPSGQKLITTYTVTPKVRSVHKDVEWKGEKITVLLMDVEIQSPDPVQVPLTPQNVYITSSSGVKSDSYFLDTNGVDYDMGMPQDENIENIGYDGKQLFKFKDGEVSLKIKPARKHKIRLAFFDPPGTKDVVLEFPSSKPWDGVVAAVGPKPTGPGPGPGVDPGPGPGGTDPEMPKKPEEEIIVVGNVPENFAFMPMSKVPEGDIADLDQVLASVENWGRAHMVEPSDEEHQVALVSGDDVVTGLYGEGIRLFPEEPGEKVKMWINEPFAAYRKGTLIAVFDPGKQEFRRPRDEDGVPEKIVPPPVEKEGGEGPAMTPDGTPAMTPDGAPAMTPEGDPAMAPEGSTPTTPPAE